MNRKEHLLTIAAEECGELAQRFTKALRFGVDETQPGHDENNNDRIYREFADLLGTFELLEREQILIKIPEVIMEKWKQNKIGKIEHYLEYSAEQGTLEEK